MKRNRWVAVGIVGLIALMSACGSDGGKTSSKSVVNGYTIKAEADLAGADLRGADLRGAYLNGAILNTANLRNADLRDAYLRDADLRHANLAGADLRGADLRGFGMSSTLVEAYLRGIIWDSSTKWPKGFMPPRSAD